MIYIERKCFSLWSYFKELLVAINHIFLFFLETEFYKNHLLLMTAWNKSNPWSTWNTRFLTRASCPRTGPRRLLPSERSQICKVITAPITRTKYLEDIIVDLEDKTEHSHPSTTFDLPFRAGGADAHSIYHSVLFFRAKQQVPWLVDIFIDRVIEIRTALL